MVEIARASEIDWHISETCRIGAIELVDKWNPEMNVIRMRDRRGVLGGLSVARGSGKKLQREEPLRYFCDESGYG